MRQLLRLYGCMTPTPAHPHTRTPPRRHTLPAKGQWYFKFEQLQHGPAIVVVVAVVVVEVVERAPEVFEWLVEIEKARSKKLQLKWLAGERAGEGEGAVCKCAGQAAWNWNGQAINLAICIWPTVSGNKKPSANDNCHKNMKYQIYAECGTWSWLPDAGATAAANLQLDRKGLARVLGYPRRPPKWSFR